MPFCTSLACMHAYTEAFPLRSSDISLDNVPAWEARGYTRADTEAFLRAYGAARGAHAAMQPCSWAYVHALQQARPVFAGMWLFCS